MRENNGKNTAGPNERASFEQFDLEHTENIKTMLAMNWYNHPGNGITLRQNRSTKHVKLNVGAPQGNEIRASEDPSAI